MHHHLEMLIAHNAKALGTLKMNLLVIFFGFRWNVDRGRQFELYGKSFTACRHYELKTTELLYKAVKPLLPYWRKSKAPLVDYRPVDQTQAIVLHQGLHYEVKEMRSADAAAAAGAAAADDQHLVPPGGPTWGQGFIARYIGHLKQLRGVLTEGDVKSLSEKEDLWRVH